jgi:fluoroquinolone transport system permease protein
MRRILTYSRNDMKLIFRDPILYIMLFVPLIFIGLLRIALPAISAVFPELKSYTMIFLGTFCLITAMFPAFIYSFVMLDEKDQDVITVFRVLPISSIEFLLVRLSFITLASFLFIYLIIASTGLVPWSAGKIFMASLPISLVAPVMSLFMVSFARNKIEGATWMKGLNFIMFLPVLSYFIQGPYEYLLGILPVYWIFKMFEPGFSVLPYSINYIIALIYHIILLLAGVSIYRSRVFP